MLLELEADGEMRFEDPPGEFGGVDLAESGREENRTAVGQAMLTDHACGPVEIWLRYDESGGRHDHHYTPA